MNLNEIVQRTTPPIPWAEGEKIPWNEPGFTQRMLREHLSQAHDAASRRLSKIDDHVAWIHADLLAGRPARVLGLGCVAARRAAPIGSAPPGSRAGHRRKRHISASGEVERYASSMQAYSEAEYSDLITTSGYNPPRLVHPC